MSNLTGKLNKGRVLVSDGAWGTYLHKKGLRPGECPESWNVERPDDVYEIASSYVNTGADMIETNSFGGNSFKLANYGLENKVYNLNKRAGEISRKAAGPELFVLGSVGPTGKMLITGEVTENDLYSAFKEQAMALAAGGVDAIIIETMTDLEESRIAVKAAKENTSCDVICTMTFEKGLNGDYHTMMGVTPAEMTETLVREGASIVGANCGNGITDMIDIVKEIRRINLTIPILIHANAGAPLYIDGETIFPESPAFMAGKVKELIEAGANIIGGCCGTTPEHISEICKVVRSLNPVSANI